jgi:hypothetical protein
MVVAVESAWLPCYLQAPTDLVIMYHQFPCTMKSGPAPYAKQIPIRPSRPIYEICPESNENEIPTLPTAVGWEGQV